MAWPPTIPPATRFDTLEQLDNHPDDHNQTSLALTELVGKWDTWTIDDTFVAADGFSVTLGDTIAYHNDAIAFLRVLLTLTQTIDVPPNGNIFNFSVGAFSTSLPRSGAFPFAQPLSAIHTGPLMAAYFLCSTGEIKLSTTSPGGVLVSGDVITLGGPVIIV